MGLVVSIILNQVVCSIFSLRPFRVIDDMVEYFQKYKEYSYEY